MAKEEAWLFEEEQVATATHETCSKRGTRLVSPPRCNTRLGKAPENGRLESGRNELILLNDLLGEGWKCQLGYGKRSLVECAFSRLKRIFGGRLRCRSFARQVHELVTKISVLNRFTRMGLPDSNPYRFESNKSGAVVQLG